MKISEFDLFLFDFDGLLVDTERLHFLAYQKAFAERLESLPIDFETYCFHAHTKKINGIQKFSSDFTDIKIRKKKIYLELLQSQAVQMMEGANEFLSQLINLDKKLCVVTNSSKDSIDLLFEKIKVLRLIKHWITREEVKEPKPDPSGYLLAIKRFAKPSDKVIGFEDTPKGIYALVETKAQPVFVAKEDHFAKMELKNKGSWHFESFSSMLANGHS